MSECLAVRSRSWCPPPSVCSFHIVSGLVHDMQQRLRVLITSSQIVVLVVSIYASLAAQPWSDPRRADTSYSIVLGKVYNA